MSDSKYSINDFTISRSSIGGIWRGVVEDNNDPLKAGRCRIRILGIHTSKKKSEQTEGVPTEHLLWAEPALPIFGGISKTGIFGVPHQGSHVFLFFERENIMQPRYFATAPGISENSANNTKGFSDPTEEFPLTKHTDFVDWNCFDEEGIEYPNVFGYSDKSGNKIIFDFTSNRERIIFQHGNKKTRITMDVEGKLKKESDKDETYTSEKTVVVSGNLKETVNGDKNVLSSNSGETVKNNKKTMVNGALDESVLGAVNKKAGSLSYDIDSDTKIKTGDKMSLVGSSIKINAILTNIENSALLGISNTSATYSTIASLTASLMGNISTTVGGGITTTVTSKAITIVTGPIVLIG
jgi:hypothetical protein